MGETYRTTVGGETVSIRKGYLGIRVVYPIKTNGKINWVNLLFGGKKNLIKLIMLMVIVMLIYFGVKELISSYQVIANNPCDFCKECATVLETGLRI